MSEQTTSAERNGVQVIARAASILRVLGGEPGGLSLGDLASRLGLARSTVQRIVGALSNEQLLMSAGPRAGVTLGPALIRLAASANVETDRIVRPVLQDLSRELGETVDLSMLQGRVAMFVDQVLGTSRIVAISAVGEAFPLHCTANGKALLMQMTPELRQRMLSGRLDRHTANTITDLASLEQQIADSAADDLSWDIEEHAEGICAVGMGFRDMLGRDFAVSIPAPTARFHQRRDEMAHHLRIARERIVALTSPA